MLLSNLFLHTLHFRNLRALTARRLLSFGLDHPNKCCVSSIRMESSSNCNLRASSSESRGALIVLEGLDRSGKTSQSSRLLSYLEGLGHSTELWRFPDRSTSVGQMISAYLSNKSHLDDRTIHLLFSANRWEKRYVLLSWIAYIYENLS
jgi:dTMP kinase